MKKIKKIFIFLIVLALLSLTCISSFAAEDNLLKIYDLADPDIFSDTATNSAPSDIPISPFQYTSNVFSRPHTGDTLKNDYFIGNDLSFSLDNTGAYLGSFVLDYISGNPFVYIRAKLPGFDVPIITVSGNTVYSGVFADDSNALFDFYDPIRVTYYIDTTSYQVALSWHDVSSPSTFHGSYVYFPPKDVNTYTAFRYFYAYTNNFVWNSDGELGLSDIRLASVLPATDTTSSSLSSYVDFADMYMSRSPLYIDESYMNGFQTGMDHGLSDGYSNGYADGKQDGHNEGYNEGFTIGKTEGFQDGYSKGETDGYNSGYTEGEHAGYNSAYPIAKEEGRQEGYNQAYQQNLEHLDSTDGSITQGFLSGMWSGMQNFVNNFLDGITFSGLSLRMVLTTLLAILFAYFVLRMVRG